MLMEGKPNTRRDRIVIGLVFAIHGTVTGTFASRLPWTAQHVHATPGSLGAVLITPTLGALAAMPATGSVVHRFGARGAMRLLLALWTAALALPGLMPNVGLLAVALTCYGASAGAADVVMNGYAVRIEERAGKSIMSGLHGMWSVGGIVGGLLGALCAGAGISALPEFLVTALVLTVITLCATTLLPVDAAQEGQIRPPRFALPSRAILGIGVVGFCAVFAEGSGSDWSAVYLTSVAHASAAIGAYCVTGFAATMALGRLLGDRIVRRYGAVWTVRVGGVIAALGAVVIVVARQPAAGIIGFAALGLGIATVVPLAFAAAGRQSSDTESPVAGIATITYTSGLLAGPSIGALGSAVSLSFAFAVVALLGCGMAVGAFTLRQRAQSGTA